jgi:hypothetical protein
MQAPAPRPRPSRLVASRRAPQDEDNKQAPAFPRRVFDSRPGNQHAIPKTSPHSRSSADDPGGGDPVSSRSGAAIRSPDCAKRNPGTTFRISPLPGSLRPTRATKSFRLASGNKRMRNAGTAQFTNLRVLRRGAHPAGRARLPAFHRGSCPRDSRIPRAQLRTMFRGTSAKLGGVFPPAPAPVAASTSRAGHAAGRRDVQSRPGTDCKSVRGHRSRPMTRLASGPPPSRERGLGCI